MKSFRFQKIVPVFAFGLWTNFSVAFATERNCEQQLGSVVVVEGDVSVKPVKGKGWLPAVAKFPLCAGDIVRSLENSKASLLLDFQDTIVRLNQNTSLALPPPKNKSFWVEVFEGAANFLSRTPQSLAVRTPFVNATVEGTEFQVAVNLLQQSSFVSVLEGVVRVANDHGQLLLKDGQTAQTRQGQAPVIRLDLKPENAVQWSLFFPKLLPLELNNPDDLFSRANRLIHSGELDKAIAVLMAVKDTSRQADALAMQAIISLKQNNIDKAYQLAQQAIIHQPVSAAARLAMSHVFQAQFQLEQAIEQIDLLLTDWPDNDFAIVRLTELYLASGNTAKALNLGDQHKQQLNTNSRFLTISAYAYLIDGDFQQSLSAFDQSIELDPSDPMNFLGKGLIDIKQGSLQAGRRHIEVAASLEPANSLIRSYLAKAYFAENRGEEAAAQLHLAKNLDPNDPTPWLYEAVMFQVNDDSYQALQSLEQSSQLNNNRAVYRSRLQLDQDKGIKNANRATIYENLGLDRLAIKEATDAVNDDFSNAAAHRFLSQAYSDKPGLTIASVSELLKSQLLDPLLREAVSPQQAESNLFINDSIRQSKIGFKEYGSMFDQEGVTGSVSLLSGEHGLFSDEIIAAQAGKNYLFSAGQFHFKTDGFYANEDLEHDIYNLFGQVRFSEDLSVLAEYRNRNTSRGDVAQRFNDLSFPGTFIQDLEEEQYRLGFRYGLNKSSYVAGVYTNKEIYNRQQLLIPDFAGPGTYVNADILNKLDVDSTEIQFFHSNNNEQQYVAGLIYYEQSGPLISNQTFVLPFPPLQVFPFFIPNPCNLVVCNDASTTIEYQDFKSFYAIGMFDVSQYAELEIGFSWDSYSRLNYDKQKFNPRLGATIKPVDNLVFNIAYAKKIKRPFASNQTLEPSNVSGLNIFHDDPNGTLIDMYGIGVDYQINDNLSLHADLIDRSTKVPVVSNNSTIIESREDIIGEINSHWVNSKGLSIKIGLIYEDLSRLNVSGLDLPLEIKNVKVPLHIKYKLSNNIDVDLKSTYIDHETAFQTAAYGGADTFWVTDLSLSRKLFSNDAKVTLGVLNLFDESFSFQNTNFDASEIRMPEYASERTVYASATIPF